MPPKHTRHRAGSSKSTTVPTSPSTTINGSTATASLSSSSSLTLDACHNSNHPCCHHLTNVAQRICPAALRIASKTTDATAAAATITPAPSVPSAAVATASHDTSPSFWTLLREYLLHERNIRIRQQQHEQRHLLSETSTKKKRKKKKKKKTSSSSTTDEPDGIEGEDSYHESTTTLTTTAAAAAASDPGCSTAATSPTPTTPMGPPPLDTVSSPPLAPTTTTTTTSAPYNDDETTREQQSRRLVRRLIDHFLDQQQPICRANNNRINNDARSVSTNGDTTVVDLSRLHEFVSALTDSSVRPKTALSTTPRKNQPSAAAADATDASGDDNFTLLPLHQIRRAVQTIQCSACRGDVERVLFPSSSSLYPSRLWLKGIQASTRYDSFEDHDEEAQTTHYQLLMEEGLEPPEHALHWSWTLTTHQDDFRSKGEETTTNIAPAKNTTLLGWELQRPRTRWLPSPSACVTNDSVWQINGCTSTAAAHPWSMADVEFLVEHYAILMGLPPDAVTMVSGSSTNDTAGAALNTIAMNVSERTNNATRKFRDLAQTIQNDLVELPSRDYFMAHNIHWDAFRTLEKVNGTCDKVLGELLTFVWDVTRSVQKVLLYARYREECSTKANTFDAEGGIEESICAGGTAVVRDDTIWIDETHWAVAQCQILWRHYFEDISRILSSVDDYHAALLNHAERSGTFPDFFVSPPLRGAFHDVVQTKLEVATFLLQKIENRTQYRTPIGPWRNANCTASTTTFLSRLWTEQAFGDSVVEVTFNSGSGHEQLDEAWRHVLFFLREMTVIEQHQRTEVKLVAGQQQRRDKLIRLLTTTLGSVGDILANPSLDDENGSDGKLNDLMDLRQDIVRATESRAVIDLADESSPPEQLKAMRSWSAKILPELQRVTHRWVGLRHHINGLTLSKKDKCLNVTPALPHSLRRSMIPGSLPFDGIVDDDDDDVQEPCNGGDGHVRATCILVSLFFQNMSERFQEWQAQKAAQELLTTMLEDDTAAQALKANKKSRKKVPKKTLSSSEMSPLVTERFNPGELTVSLMENEVIVSERSTGGHGADVSVVYHEANQLIDILPQTDEQSSNEPSDTLNDDDEEEDTPAQPEPDWQSNGVTTIVTDPELEPAISSDSRSSAMAATTQLNDDDDDDTVKEIDAVVNGVIAVETSQITGLYDDRSGGFQEAESFLVGRLLSLIDTKDDLIMVHE